MAPLVLGLALELTCTFASPPQLVLIFLAHGCFASSWYSKLPTFGPTSIHSRALVVSTWLMYTIAFKQAILTLVPAAVHHARYGLDLYRMNVLQHNQKCPT